MEKNSYSNFLRLILSVTIVFSASLLYLHQKILCYVTAYQLTGDYHKFTELVDKKDYLVYNLSKEISLAKIHQWTESNMLLSAKPERVVALKLKEKDTGARKTKLAFISRFLKVSADIPGALAKDR